MALFFGCGNSVYTGLMHFDEFDEFTRKLCVETERIILQHYDSPDLEVIRKSDHTPVTAADKHSEKIMREAIETVYPEHGILGEEYGAQHDDAEFVWVIDPIDGTKTFASGCPLFGTMIGLMREGEPLFGCVNYPALGKRLYGDGKRALVNNDFVRARSGIPLGEATLLTTDYSAVDRHRGGENFARLDSRVGMTRTWGDCYGYYLLAVGKADIMLDPIMNPWDLLPLIPIVRGAGATVTDWQGGNPAKGDSLVAANSDLHDEVLQLLNAS